MNEYEVEIPCWSDGVPLNVTGIQAATGEEAYRKVVDWVNRYAGYHYCDRLPEGTKVRFNGSIVDIADTPIVVKS